MSGSGQHNVATGPLQVMDLTATSQRHRLEHQALLADLAAKQVAATLHVPTLPDQVRQALRNLGLPVRLFGENLANVRDRLRMALAHKQVAATGAAADATAQEGAVKEEEEEELVTKYTRATQALLDARQEMARFSLQRAQARLARERKLRSLAVKRKRGASNEPENDEGTKKQAAQDDLMILDDSCRKLYKQLRNVGLEGSQYGDSRALSCLACTTSGMRINNKNAPVPVVVTASWTGSLHLWDGSSAVLEPVGSKKLCHEDRIMGLSVLSLDDDNGNNSEALVATASLDKTAKLFRIKQSDVVMQEEESEKNEESPSALTLTEEPHLVGHQARLCKTAFHPLKRHVATTSFDHSWRLWDIETGQNLLLQDGHWKECYGVGFHGDGSLCATTDFAGVVQLWDLRTGKSIHHFIGHAKRVLQAEFAVTGFQLATAGDDGTIKIWDLRRRKLGVTVPAHSKLVTQLKFDPTGEFLASSSFDGTCKLWATRDWKMLNQLQAHEGKVSGIDILPNNSIVTCGFDKTLKLWQ